jgi:hypothetical protein
MQYHPLLVAFAFVLASAQAQTCPRDAVQNAANS